MKEINNQLIMQVQNYYLYNATEKLAFTNDDEVMALMLQILCRLIHHEVTLLSTQRLRLSIPLRCEFQALLLFLVFHTYQ